MTFFLNRFVLGDERGERKSAELIERERSAGVIDFTKTVTLTSSKMLFNDTNDKGIIPFLPSELKYSYIELIFGKISFKPKNRPMTSTCARGCHHEMSRNWREREGANFYD